MKNRSIRKTATTARHLRRNSTGPEHVLWNVLRNRGLAGLKFRRQHPINSYVVDYFCHEAQLVLELDGVSHDGKDVEYDRQRQQTLESKGLAVLRLSSDDVLTDIDAVVEAILLAAGRDAETGKPTQQPSPAAETATSPRGHWSRHKCRALASWLGCPLSPNNSP